MWPVDLMGALSWFKQTMLQIIHSVRRIVALKVCCKFGRACKYASLLHGSSQPIANSLFVTKHAKNYGIDIFDYEGHAVVF